MKIEYTQMRCVINIITQIFYCWISFTSHPSLHQGSPAVNPRAIRKGKRRRYDVGFGCDFQFRFLRSRIFSLSDNTMNLCKMIDT